MACHNSLRLHFLMVSTESLIIMISKGCTLKKTPDTVLCRNVGLCCIQLTSLPLHRPSHGVETNRINKQLYKKEIEKTLLQQPITSPYHGFMVSGTMSVNFTYHASSKKKKKKSWPALSRGRPRPTLRH